MGRTIDFFQSFSSRDTLVQFIDSRDVRISIDSASSDFSKTVWGNDFFFLTKTTIIISAIVPRGTSTITMSPPYSFGGTIVAYMGHTPWLSVFYTPVPCATTVTIRSAKRLTRVSFGILSRRVVCNNAPFSATDSIQRLQDYSGDSYPSNIESTDYGTFFFSFPI